MLVMLSDFNNKRIRLLTLLLLSTFIFPCWAFDNNRDGFAVGLGFGTQSTTVDMHAEGEVFTDDYTGMTFSFRLGLGFTSQFLYFYSVEGVMYEATDGIDGELVSYSSSMNGVGASYYFSPKSPSAYVTGGVGWGKLSIKSASFSDEDDGSSFMIGGGYEFMGHQGVEFNILSTSIPSKYVEIESIDTASFRLMYQYTFY